MLTDLDPYTTAEGTPKDYGTGRAHSLCPFITPGATLPSDTQEPAYYEQCGIFLNRSTLEIELNGSGCIYLMNSVMQALCDVSIAKKRFEKLADDTKKAKAVVKLDDPERFIKDIEYVGKGRFAQRLCAAIRDLDPKYNVCPGYILKAVEHVAK